MILYLRKMALTVQIWAIKGVLWFESKMMSWGRFYPLWDMYLSYLPAITNCLK